MEYGSRQIRLQFGIRNDIRGREFYTERRSPAAPPLREETVHKTCRNLGARAYAHRSLWRNSFSRCLSKGWGAIVVNETIRRGGIDPEVIDDVVFAQSYADSETPCVGRWIALEAGLPVSVPGMQIDRRCGNGLQSVATAAMMVASGACDVIVALGVESMSRTEHYTTPQAYGGGRAPGLRNSMIGWIGVGKGLSPKIDSATFPV